jgi:uncharacterized cupin superfamily protein
MTSLALIIDTVSVNLEPMPIPSSWISGGTPVARCKKILTSRDHTSTTVVWDCTPGSFYWRYGKDETIYVISGEAFMTDEDGGERRFAAGELGFFPAGFECQWRVTEHFRKVAIFKEKMWMPVGLGFKLWNKLVAMARIPRSIPVVAKLPVFDLKSARNSNPGRA